MKNSSLKKWFFASGLFAGLGIACFIVKLIEATLRTAHTWASTFVILGFVFLGLAVLVLCAMLLVDHLQSKNNNGKEYSNEELLEKYKSKKAK